MEFCRRLFAVCIPGVIVALLLCAPCHAQLAASKVLTQTDPAGTASQKSTAPVEPDANCTSSGVLGAMDPTSQPKILKLSVTEVKQLAQHKDGSLSVTVRLQNIWDDTVFIPWVFTPVDPVPSEKNDATSSYETAAVSLVLTAAGTRQQIYPDDEARIWGKPRNFLSHLAIDPGHWIEITFAVAPFCKAGDKEGVCGKYLQGGTIQLNARWNEDDITLDHTGGQCVRSTFTTREVDAEPFDLSVPFQANQQDSTPKAPTSLKLTPQ